VAIKVIETTCIALTFLYFKANLLSPYVSIPSGVTVWYSSRNFSCMVITSCMGAAVSDFSAEWLLGGNVFYATF